MAQITAALVKQLREMTGSGMMECKKALVEAEGDLEAAIDVLRKMGLAKAIKRSGRDTNEGTVAIYVTDDAAVAGIVQLTCETDFVGSNAKFKGFAADLAKVVAENAPADADAFMACPMANATVSDELTEMIHVIGENMKVLSFERVAASNGALGSYVHSNGKLAVVVECALADAANAQKDAFKAFAHDVAMHVAAINPVSARREDVPADVIEREKAIYMAQAAESGKPEAIQEKIATGKLEKYYKENILTEQPFVKNGDITVAQYAAQVSKEIGDKIEIVSFKRINFGE